MREIRFGIIGTGNIATKFCTACGLTEGATAYAVASRSLDTGWAFAAAKGLSAVYGSVAALAQDPMVDCVYVATPHPMHAENCRQALESGKPVLCEKPMALNRQDAESLFALAREKRLFLMEGMWTRFLPGTRQALSWLKSGAIGTLKLMDFEFCYQMDEANPPPRLVLAEYGGGSLYDVGVYGIEMASFFAGANPEAFEGLLSEYAPGVDALAALVLRYPGGALATVRSAITCDSPCRAILFGTRGRIEIDSFYLASNLRLISGGHTLGEFHSSDDVAQGLRFQVQAVCADLRQGALQSTVVPPEDTIAAMTVLGQMMGR